MKDRSHRVWKKGLQRDFFEFGTILKANRIDLDAKIKVVRMYKTLQDHEENKKHRRHEIPLKL